MALQILFRNVAIETTTLILTGLSLVVGVIAAVAAIYAVRYSREQLTMAREDREIQLRVIEQDVYGVDGEREMDDVKSVPRFLIQNAGEKGMNIRYIVIDTLPDEPESVRAKSAIGTGMQVVDGPAVPGRLEPGDVLKLNAREAARDLARRGYFGEVKTYIAIRDALDRERRFPVRLYIKGNRLDSW